MRTRILVGIIGIPLVLIPIWLGGLWAVALFLVIGVIGGIEFYNMMQMGGYHPRAGWALRGWLRW
ncbi:MAG: hypothetical protein HC802_03620 [Caldilineaceae bacterium]|nr:hypothetical protein [Caldilineaceae bacterium]